VARNRRPRAHSDTLTVAIRGPVAEKTHQMAESYGMGLAKLLMDAVLVYEAQVAEGYKAGTRLASWAPGETE
jgi:hypothetical protein